MGWNWKVGISYPHTRVPGRYLWFVICWESKVQTGHGEIKFMNKWYSPNSFNFTETYLHVPSSAILFARDAVCCYVEISLTSIQITTANCVKRHQSVVYCMKSRSRIVLKSVPCHWSILRRHKSAVLNCPVFRPELHQNCREICIQNCREICIQNCAQTASPRKLSTSIWRHLTLSICFCLSKQENYLRQSSDVTHVTQIAK